MTEYDVLEIGLHEREGVMWRVDLRFDYDLEEAGRPSGEQLVARIDPAELRLIADDDEYGRALGRALFGDRIGGAYRTAAQVSAARGAVLRVRIFVGPSAARLHGVRWELMRDPEDDAPLVTKQNVLFSRFLSSSDWRPVTLKAKRALRAIAVVAGPSDLDEFDVGRALAPVDVDQEVAQVRAGLVGLAPTVLAGPGRRPTAERLLAELSGGCDILYLVCHGFLADGAPRILLETAEGRSDSVEGALLVERLRELRQLPRLVVLASCQTAGHGDDTRSDDGGVLAALGPRLAEAGVPAVLAMQGDISMTTMSRFVPVFFGELQIDGQVDRAVAAARATVRPDRPDWWVPALFMRLRTGRMWYVSGFSQASDFEKLPLLVGEIRDRRCTPVLGPGITDPLLGSRQDIAQRWAQSFRFPLAPHARDDLPQVAQYLSVQQGRRFPRNHLGKYLRQSLVESYGDRLDERFRDRDPEDLPLGALMSDAWRVCYPAGSPDPYAALAELPIPVYVTVQPWNLLEEALRAAGRPPTVELCRWQSLRPTDAWDDDLPSDADWPFSTPDDSPAARQAAEAADWPPSVFDLPGSRYRPDAQHPLVYHLFGHHARPRSLVVTEDDYFDFLIGITREEALVPDPVLRRLTDSTLLFVGFRLDEWDFRVLFRSIMNREGGRLGDYDHVAVQIDPEEGRTIEPARARRYLEQYFQNSKITIFWGNAETFLNELLGEWRKQR